MRLGMTTIAATALGLLIGAAVPLGAHVPQHWWPRMYGMIARKRARFTAVDSWSWWRAQTPLSRIGSILP